MRNTVRDYAWGHRTWIKDLVGPTMECPVIQAELWMGAHPGSPSSVLVDGEWKALSKLIADDPKAWIGEAALSKGFNGLPFLAKFLAADKPLSIQCHPSLNAAKKGFAAEEAQGIRRDAENRNYKDANHKPEIICALSEFTALSGFRKGSDIAADFKKLSSATKDQVALSAFEYFAGLAREEQFIDLTKSILSLGSQAAQVTNEASRIAAEIAADAGTGAGGLNKEIGFEQLALAAKYFPGDAGLFFFIVLNLFVLQPGQALFAPAGVLHAYVKGLGIEVMANSDNVLRGGLTPKYIDIPELLKNLDPSIAIKSVATKPSGDLISYDTPAPEFHLSKIPTAAAPRQLKLENKGGPEVLICVKGRAWVGTDKDKLAGDEAVDLFKGTSVYLRPSGKPTFLKLEPDTEIFRVELG